MTAEEQQMLDKVVKWLEDLDTDDMPEGIQESLNTIYDEIAHLLSLIPEEH
jgi:hypothetical protein